MLSLIIKFHFSHYFIIFCSVNWLSASLWMPRMLCFCRMVPIVVWSLCISFRGWQWIDVSLYIRYVFTIVQFSRHSDVIFWMDSDWMNRITWSVNSDGAFSDIISDSYSDLYRRKCPLMFFGCDHAMIRRLGV